MNVSPLSEIIFLMVRNRKGLKNMVFAVCQVRVLCFNIIKIFLFFLDWDCIFTKYHFWNEIRPRWNALFYILDELNLNKQELEAHSGSFPPLKRREDLWNGSTTETSKAIIIIGILHNFRRENWEPHFIFDWSIDYVHSSNIY